MSTTDTKNDSSKHLWNPLLNFATLPAAGHYLGIETIGKLRNYSVFQWIPTASLTPTEFAVGGALNAAALSVSEYISGRDGAEIDFTRMVIITLTLATMVFAAPHVTKATSKWTGVVLTTDQMLSIAAFNGLVKLTTLAFVSFMKYMQDSSIAPIPTSNEDARKISQYQAAYFYDLFKEESTKWNDLPLSIRVILNMRFKENGLDEQLPLKGFKDKVGEKMEAEELQFLLERTKGSTDFSNAERKHLNSLFYEAGLHEGIVVSKDTMPEQVGKNLAGYKATDFATLQEPTVRWICYYLRVFPNPVDADKARALSDRMLDLKISSPNLDLVPSKKPTAPKDIAHLAEDEKYLLGWFFGYFKQNTAEFDALSIDERIAWNNGFVKELGKRVPLALTADEASKLKDGHAVYFWHLCNDYKEYSHQYWTSRPIEVQKALNAKFDSLRFVTRALYPQTKTEALGMSEIELLTLHNELQANVTYITYLNKEVQTALASKFTRLGLWMPFAPKPDPTLTDKFIESLTMKNILISGTLLAGLGLTCYFVGPPLIAALGAMFKGTNPANNGCTVTLESEKSHTLGEKDVVCFEPNTGLQKLTAASAADYPNGVLAIGDKVDLTAHNILCIGEHCETSLRPIVGGSAPYNVTLTPYTKEFPDLLINTPLVLGERGINVLHQGQNVTISDGMTVDDYTFVKGNVISINQDGHICVGTETELCGKVFTTNGVTLTPYIPPVVTEEFPDLLANTPLVLGERGINVLHQGQNVTISDGMTVDDYTFVKGNVISINQDGHICVGTEAEACVKTFTTDGVTLSPYTPPPVVTTVSLTSDFPVTLDDNVLVKVSHDSKEFTISIGNSHGDYTFVKGDVVSINQEGRICVGTKDQPCGKVFTTDGITLSPYIPQPVVTTVSLTSGSPVTLDDNVLVKVSHDSKEFTISLGDTHGDHTFVKGDIVSIHQDGHICVGTETEACVKTFTTDGTTLSPYTKDDSAEPQNTEVPKTSKKKQKPNG
jgi:hypothetical protein